MARSTTTRPSASPMKKLWPTTTDGVMMGGKVFATTRHLGIIKLGENEWERIRSRKSAAWNESKQSLERPNGVNLLYRWIKVAFSVHNRLASFCSERKIEDKKKLGSNIACACGDILCEDKMYEETQTPTVWKHQTSRVCHGIVLQSATSAPHCKMGACFWMELAKCVEMPRLGTLTWKLHMFCSSCTYGNRQLSASDSVESRPVKVGRLGRWSYPHLWRGLPYGTMHTWRCLLG